jgi:hypothetical protein
MMFLGQFLQVVLKLKLNLPNKWTLMESEKHQEKEQLTNVSYKEI